jgi:ABC-type multidrug transport system fused ATPase/permease subunit
LVEPLGAPESGHEARSAAGQGGSEAPNPGIEQAWVRGTAIEMENVSVRASGHLILRDINLALTSGSHVAIVGPSGAGKSSLVGLLLGWHPPASGRILIDGSPLDSCLNELRRDIAWVDPTVQLWNLSLLQNLTYGSDPGSGQQVGKAVEAADLHSILEKLPDGFETPLGEAGGLLSGGEGQRVRLGRAMLRPGIRLAILDEPFRGLDREKRRLLLARARRLWPGSTLLCITHDVAETLSFERVLVVEGGRIVEDGSPEALAGLPDSRYRALLEAEKAVRKNLWSGEKWRRLRLDNGTIVCPSAGEERP